MYPLVLTYQNSEINAIVTQFDVTSRITVERTQVLRTGARKRQPRDHHRNHAQHGHQKAGGALREAGIVPRQSREAVGRVPIIGVVEIGTRGLLLRLLGDEWRAAHAELSPRLSKRSYVTGLTLLFLS
jgi:hypothetical protein